MPESRRPVVSPVIGAEGGWAGLDAHRARLEQVIGVNPESAENELRKTAIELADAQRLAQVGSFRIDFGGDGVPHWSDELYRILGLDPSTFEPYLGALVERVHPDDRPLVEAIIEGAFQRATPFEVEARVVRPDGELRVVTASARVIVDELGQPGCVVGVCQDITSRKTAQDALAHQSAHDALTSLPNRMLLLDRLTVATAHRDRARSGATVFYVDIDRFEWLNDRVGHAAGDELLVEVARRLEAVVNARATVARVGGDEFVIVCEDLDREGIVAVARHVLSAVACPVWIDGTELTPTVSIGIAVSHGNEDGTTTPDSLLRAAEIAMYKAKQRGRACFEIFDTRMRADVATRLETETGLRRALEKGDIVPYFQPVVDLASGRAIGVEALARWRQQSGDVLFPGDFVPLAEENGLVVPMGAQILARACEVVVGWRRSVAELSGLAVSVNLSARQIMHPDIVGTVRDVLAQSGLPPHALCLEITESVLLDDAELSTSVLAALKSLGVQIGLDDFGTGYSSLTYLRRFPVDVLKIDRSFVEGVGDKHEDRAIVAAITDLSRALGMATVGEGVETEAQARELRALGCERAQGYLWSRAVPEPEALTWMRSACASSLRQTA